MAHARSVQIAVVETKYCCEYRTGTQRNMGIGGDEPAKQDKPSRSDERMRVGGQSAKPGERV